MTRDAAGRRSRKAELLGALLVALGILVLSQLALDAQPAFGFNQSPNNRNVSVDTRVNITGSRPEIIAVYLQDPITLAAGSLRVDTCNVTVRDYNGFADIDTVNATFFNIQQSSLGAADDNNTHYSNGSCAVIAGQQGGAFANYTCSIPLTYYAVNGTWNCTGIVNDTSSFTGNGSGKTNISALFALNVTPLIDYGDMAMGDTSGDVPANVSNLGNRPINVTVRGYGTAFNDGLSFVCEQGNLTIDLEHFAANATAAYAEKQALASAYAQVAGLTVPKPQNASGTLNTTYWQLYLDLGQNAFGLCNGTVVFQAESPG